MKDKIAEYKERRAARILARLDAKNDTDEGRWVTTENDNRIHLNKNGVPDKGNPFVLAAMTGKKPKLSMNYHQKNVAKAAKSGNATDVLDELLKIPNGSKVLINGEKYKANFGDDESGRWIDFVNTEDEDDVLSTFEVAMAIQENGDVSLEAPDRKEKESEPEYEPDVEPENEEYFPDDDIEMPDSPEDYGEVSPQEEPDNVPEEVAPQENPDDLPTGIAPQDAGALGPSVMAGELKSIIKNQVSDDISDADFVAGYEEAISQLEGMADGTQIKVGDKTYTKTNDPDYPYVLDTTGQTVSADTVYNSLETAATIDDDFEMEVVEPEEKETGESNPVSENKKQAYELLKSIMGLKYGDLENGEWDSAYDKAKEIIEGIPEGTEISVGGYKLQKYDDSVFPLVDAETGELHSVGDLTNFLNEENNEGVIIGSQEEEIPQENTAEASGVSFEDSKNDILDIISDKKNGKFVPDNAVKNAFKNLPDGTLFTTKFGAKWEKKTGEDGSVYFENENGSTNPATSMFVSMAHHLSPSWNIEPPEGFTEETAPQEQSVENPKKDKLQKALDTFKHQNKEVDIIDALDSLEDGDVITVGKHTYTKTKDKNGSFFDTYTDENGTKSGNYVVKQALKEAVYLDLPVDVKGAEPKTEMPLSSSANASQDFSNDIKKAKHKKEMLTSEEWDKYSDQVIDPINDKLQNAPAGSEITVKNSYGDLHYTKGDNGVWETDDGITAGSYGIAYALVNHDNFSLQEINFVNGPKSESVSSQNSGKLSAQGQKAQDKLKSFVKEYADFYFGDAKVYDNEGWKNALNDLSDGSTIKIGEQKYIKTTQNGESIFTDQEGDDTNLSHLSMEIKSTIKNNGSANLDVQISEPGNQLSGTKDNLKYSGTKANGSDEIQAIKDDINSFVSDVKLGNIVSKSGFGHKLSGLEDGSSIKLGNKTYIKGTDDDGNVSFQNSINEYDTLTASGLAAKIEKKAKDFDNPIIEVNDKEHSPKRKSSTMAPVYIPESIPEPKKADSISFSNDDFSQERKDNAVWDTGNGQSFDNVMRGISGKVWQGLNKNAKNAVWEYTTSSAPGNFSNINNYLRKPDHDHQSEEMQHKMRNRIGYITKAISQSQAPQDMWVQRGIPLKNLRRLFGVSEAEFDEARKNGGADAVLDLFKSSVPYGQDEGFMSCGSTKGHGFSGSDVILNVYCPKGTQMLYSEPFSAFGHGGGKSWDGTSKQNWFSSEDETILQRGTKLVPTKVSYSDGKWFVDVDVIGQEYSEKI